MKKPVVNRKKGFTLVELVIVIAVIAVLAAILIPTFGNVIKSARLEKARANANNATKQLRIEAVYDNVSYYSTERAKEILEEKGYDLKTEVKGYSFYYNVSSNTVEYLEDSAVLSNTTDSGGIKTVYADGEAKAYPITVETINEKKTHYRYIDNDGAYTSIISAIKNLPKNGNNSISEMKMKFDAMVKSNKTAYNAASSHFNNFNTDNALYFSEDGDPIITLATGSEFTFKNVVFQEGIIGISEFNNTPDNASASDYISKITILNDVVIPASVKYIDGNAFKGFYGKSNETTGDDKLSLILTGSNNPLPSTGLSNVTVSSGQSDTRGNTIVLGANDYTLSYGYIKEGVFSDGTVEVVRAKAANGTVALNKDGYTTKDKDLVREYYVPQIGIEKSVIDMDNVETVELRYVEEDGLRKYTMVVLMKDATTYVARNVAVITEASVRYGDYNRYASQEITVYMNQSVKDKSYANLKNMNYHIKYQEGAAKFVEVLGTKFITMYVQDFTQPIKWSDKIKEFSTIQYDEKFRQVVGVVAGTDPTYAFNYDAIDYSKESCSGQFNVINVTELSITVGDTTIYREYYSKK